MQDYSILKTQVLNDISKDKEVVNSVNAIKKNYKNGTSKYSDATKLAKSISKVASKSLVKNIDETDLSSYAGEVVAPVYRSAQSTVLNASKTVQKAMNKKANLGLKPADVETDESRIQHIITRFKEAESIDDVSFLLGEDVIENILHSAVTDSIQANAKRFDDAGFETYVTRSDGSGCCDWCSSVVGTYTLDNLPNDFWAVHKGCSCQFDYKAKGSHNRITFDTGTDGKMRKITKSI